MSDGYRIIWAPVALDDFEEILDYIAERDSPAAAARVGRSLLERVERLSSHPLRCRIVPELREVGVRLYRELILRPHRVVFRTTGHTLEVVGVLDGRRDLEELLLNRLLPE